MTTKPLTVLLIDDDPDTRNMFQIVMSHYNINYATADTAQNAFNYLNGNVPDVILVDIMLPDMDGYQALDYIRENTLASQSNIIATTAYYTAMTQSEVLERGFNGYLPKPFNPTTLIPYLQQIAKDR